MRRAIDAAKHPALLMVDTISSLASIDYRHDEWGVDVTVAGSQKGLMLPPGLSLQCGERQGAGRHQDGEAAEAVLVVGGDGRPATRTASSPTRRAPTCSYGLAEAIDMLHEEGLDNVFARHDRHAEGVRRAVKAWGLEILCKDPKYYSSVLTAVIMPEGHNADNFRKVTLEAFDVSLGTGLTKLAGKVFRIGHLGDTNDLTILGTLAGVRDGLRAGRRAAQAGRRARGDGLLHGAGQGLSVIPAQAGIHATA